MRTASLPMVLALTLFYAVAAEAQPRTDILTGEPVRPSTSRGRPEPEIFNAPHAPRQDPGRAGGNPPMEIYVAPQFGTGTQGYDQRSPVRPRQRY